MFDSLYCSYLILPSTTVKLWSPPAGLISSVLPYPIDIPIQLAVFERLCY